MQHDIRWVAIFDKVLVRRHVARNHHSPTSVVDAVTECVLQIRMLYFEGGHADAVLVVHNTLLNVFRGNTYLPGSQIGSGLATIVDIGLIGLFELRHHFDCSLWSPNGKGNSRNEVAARKGLS